MHAEEPPLVFNAVESGELYLPALRTPETGRDDRVDAHPAWRDLIKATRGVARIPAEFKNDARAVIAK
jgi:hypothetical protein